jgi:hypothetical protein
MEEENRALFEDVKRLRSWRERLEEENSDLREKGLRDEEEMKRLENCMKTLMDEKVAVVEKAAVSVSVLDTSPMLNPSVTDTRQAPTRNLAHHCGIRCRSERLWNLALVLLNVEGDYGGNQIRSLRDSPDLEVGTLPP